MSTQLLRRYTPDEYLNAEREATYRSQYVDGRIFAMAGASPAHSLIAVNAGAELRAALKPTPCRVFSSDLRIKAGAADFFTYPDLTVICGGIQYADSRRPETATNPRLIVEILSDSTECFDRGDKSEYYRQIPSLQEYVLIQQKRPQIESFLRQQDGEQWTLTVAKGVDARLELKSIGATISLAEIYEYVEFPTEPILTDATAPGND